MFTRLHLAGISNTGRLAFRNAPFNMGQKAHYTICKEAGSKKIKESDRCRPVMDTRQLFSAISELNKYNISLRSLPPVVVCGPQSSGKTSVIESICGKGLFPKAMGMSTMKPFHITTIRSSEVKIKIGEKVVTGEQEAREEIDRVNRNNYFKTVDITIHAPNIYNNYLVDLPGLIASSEGDDPQLPKDIKKINTKYLEDLNSIPVIVHAASADPATNQAIQLVKKVGKTFEAFGIITKVDMISNTKEELLEKLLKGSAHKLGHGYCGVILRNEKDIKSNISIQDKVKEEEQFHLRNPHLDPFGTEEMKRILSHIQFQKIRTNIPALLEDIDKEIEACKASDTLYDAILNSKDNQLPSRLSKIFEKLVYSSVDRSEFEENLKKRFETAILGYLEKSLPQTKGPSRKLSEKKADPAIVDFLNRKLANPDLYKKDDFKELFSAGLMSTSNNSEQIKKAIEHETMAACMMELFDYVVDDPAGKKRNQFNKILNNYVDSLLVNENIQNLIQKITLEELNKYVQNDLETAEKLARTFAEYMINEIGEEAFKSQIRYSIYAMVNIERRPIITPTEFNRYLTQMYKEEFTFSGASSFLDIFKSKQKVVGEIYGPDFAASYLRAVTENFIYNCYRNVAVNYLDPLVGKIIEKLIDLCQEGNVKRRQATVSEKVNKLNELKQAILPFYIQE